MPRLLLFLAVIVALISVLYALTSYRSTSYRRYTSYRRSYVTYGYTGGSGGFIAGYVIGGLFGLGLLFVAIYFLVRHCNKKKRMVNPRPMQPRPVVINAVSGRMVQPPPYPGPGPAVYNPAPPPPGLSPAFYPPPPAYSQFAQGKGQPGQGLQGYGPPGQGPSWSGPPGQGPQGNGPSGSGPPGPSAVGAGEQRTDPAWPPAPAMPSSVPPVVPSAVPPASTAANNSGNAT